MLLSASRRFWSSVCFSSWSLNRSVIFFFAISAALLRSFSSLWISWWIPAISWRGLFLGQMLLSSRSSCSFSWKRSRRSLSDSTSPGSILSSSSDSRRWMCCTSLLRESYSNLSFAISANLAPNGTSWMDMWKKVEKNAFQYLIFASSFLLFYFPISRFPLTLAIRNTNINSQRGSGKTS